MASGVQTTSNSSAAAANLAVTLSGMVSGNLIVVWAEYSNSYILNVGDSQGNAYTRNATGSGWSQWGFNIWSATAQSGNNTITVSGGAPATNGSFAVTAREINNALTTITAVGSGSQSPNANSGNTQSITPSQPSFVYAAHHAISGVGSIVAASGWTAGVRLYSGNQTELWDMFHLNWPGDATNCPGSYSVGAYFWDNLAVGYKSSGTLAVIFLESGPKRQYRREGRTRWPN